MIDEKITINTPDGLYDVSINILIKDLNDDNIQIGETVFVGKKYSMSKSDYIKLMIIARDRKIRSLID